MIARNRHMKEGRASCALVLLGALLILARATASSIGFRQIEIPDLPGKPLSIGVWYPSSSPLLPTLSSLFARWLL
jgi:hypothetical protein